MLVCVRKDGSLDAGGSDRRGLKRRKVRRIEGGKVEELKWRKGLNRCRSGRIEVKEEKRESEKL
jgi:hypothetical protein